MPTQLSFLRDVVAAAGPCATVCLDVSRDAEDAQDMIDLRWRAIWQRLAQAGAPAQIRSLAERAVGQKRGAAGRASQFMVVTADGVLLDEMLAAAPVREVADWAPLPHLMPLLTMAPPQTSHIVLRLARADADLTVVAPAGESQQEVHGGRWPLTKVHSGGWSQRRIQARAENLWEKNAKEVAERVDSWAVEIDPAFVAVRGDVRAKAAFLEQIGPRVAAKVVDLDDLPGDPDVGLAEVIARHAADDDAVVIDRLRAGLGRRRGAVQGLGDVVAAARWAQIESLVLENELSATTRLWAGPEPLDIGIDPGDLPGADAVPDRADAVLIRALAAADADLVLVRPGGIGLRDGVGAVLRYTDPSTTGP